MHYCFYVSLEQPYNYPHYADGINETQRGYLTSKFTQLVLAKPGLKLRSPVCLTVSWPSSCALRLGRALGMREGYTIPPSHQDHIIMGPLMPTNADSHSAKAPSLVLPLDPIPFGLAHPSCTVCPSKAIPF